MQWIECGLQFKIFLGVFSSSVFNIWVLHTLSNYPFILSNLKKKIELLQVQYSSEAFF